MRVLLLLLLVSPWAAAEGIIGIGKLKLDMTMSDVISQLGHPHSKEEQADFITDIYKYPNIEAYFNGANLVGIYSEARDVCTPEKVCPGDSLNVAIAAYGDFHEKSGGIVEFYSKLEFTCWYRMQVTDSAINSIEVACQP